MHWKNSKNILTKLSNSAITVNVETNTEDTMEILVYYVVPNIALFGGIYLLAKGMEHAFWHFINNYDNIVNKLTQQ